MTSAPGSPAGAGRRWTAEAWALALYALLLLLTWVAGFRPFYLPNNDYFSFQRTAESLAAGDLPSQYKRMPLFPALMALGAPAFRGSAQPYLDAALAWNLLFALGLLGVVGHLGRRLLGRGGMVLALALGTSVPFQSMARQPLVDPSLAFFVALAVALLLKGSRWAYAAAALALMSRLESGVVLAVIVLARTVFPAAQPGDGAGARGGDRPGAGAAATWKRRAPAEVVLAGLSALPAAAWVLLGMRFGSDDGGYLAMMAGAGFTPAWAFPEVALRQSLAGLFDPLLPGPILALIAGPIAVFGMLRLARRDRLAAVSLALVYLLSVAAIVAFGISKARYALPTIWIPTAVLLAGLPPFAQVRRPSIGRAYQILAWAAAAIGGAWMIGHWSAAIRLEPSLAPARSDLILFGSAAALAGIALLGRRPSAASALTLALVLWPLFGGGIALSRYELNKVRYHNVEAYLLGDWASRSLGPGDGLVTLATSQVRFLAPGLPMDQVVSFQDVQPEGRDSLALARAMRARGLNHVAYTYRESPRDADGAYYHRLYNVPLAERFAAGGPVPGFQHVATLPVPPALQHADVQIYRIAPP